MIESVVHSRDCGSFRPSSPPCQDILQREGSSERCIFCFLKIMFLELGCRVSELECFIPQISVVLHCLHIHSYIQKGIKKQRQP